MIEGDLVRKHARGCALTLTLLLSALYGAPAQAKTSGGFADDGVKIRFRDAVAFWRSEGFELILFPFQLSDDEREGLTHREQVDALLAAHGEEEYVGVFASFEGAPSVSTLKSFTLYHSPAEGGSISHLFVNGKDNPNWAGAKLDENVQRLKLTLPRDERPGRLDLITQYRGRWGTRWQIKVSKVPLLVPRRQPTVSPVPTPELATRPDVRERDGWLTSDLGECSFYNQLRVDGEGRPHVALATGHALTYGLRTERGWAWETVAGDAGWLGGPIMDLALDGDSQPQLAYLLGGSVRHAERDGSNWSDREVAPAELHADWVNLALDAEGRPTVVFSGSALRAATPSRRGFALRSIADEVEIGTSQVLALSVDGSVHVVFERDRQAVHAWSDGKSWQTEQVCEASETPALASGPDGRLHLLVRNGSELQHLVFGDGWSEPERVFKGDVDEPRLAVGHDGSVHAAWLTERGKRVIHAQRGAEGWQVAEVAQPESEGRPNGWLSLAAGPDGKAHLSFVWQTGTGFDSRLSLRYVTQSGSTPGAAQRDPGSLPASTPKPQADAEPSDAEPADARPTPSASPTVDPGAQAQALAQAHPKQVARIEAEVTKRAERWFSLRSERALRCRDCAGELHVTCKPCKGRERVRCEGCNGSGERVRRANGRRYRNTCYTCDGSGAVECKACDEGQVDCETCLPARVAGYRAVAGRRAFWDFLSPTARQGFKRTEHFPEVVAGRDLDEVCGETLALRRATLEQVQVLADRVITVASVVWADGETGQLTTTWYRVAGRYYLATPRDRPEPLLE